MGEDKKNKRDVLGLAGVDPDSSYGKLLAQLVSAAEQVADGSSDIRSIAVVVDYNLPDQAGASLPPGVWLAKGIPTVGVASAMLPQLSRMHAVMAQSIANTILQQQHMSIAPRDTMSTTKPPPA